MSNWLIVGAIAMVLGAIVAALKYGQKLGAAEGDKKLDAAEDAARKALREKAMEGQAIQEEVHTMPIDAVREELKKRAGK